MKVVEWGIQENTWAAKNHNAHGAVVVEMRPVQERYFRFYLPWRRLRYCINQDAEIPLQPCFGVYWFHPFPRVTMARWAWQ